jgi:hypothetical protein
LGSDCIGHKIQSVDINSALHARLLKQLPQSIVVGSDDHVLDLLRLSIDKDRSRQLQLLEDFRRASQVERGLAAVVDYRIIDQRLLKQSLDNNVAPKLRGKMQRCVSLAVAGIDVDVGATG